MKKWISYILLTLFAIAFYGGTVYGFIDKGVELDNGTIAFIIFMCFLSALIFALLFYIVTDSE